MKGNYAHLFSPIKVGNLVLKNRLISTNSMPHFIQGPEKHPNEAMIHHLAQRARNGAGVVTVAGIASSLGEMTLPFMDPEANDPAHFQRWDLYDPQCQNGLIQLADAIHFYGGKASMNLAPYLTPKYGVCENPDFGMEELPRDMIESVIDSYVEQAVICKRLGWDIASVHAAYRVTYPAQFLSPATNHRTDEYGGNLENRARFLLEVCRRIKAACGQDFVVECVISGKETEAGGYDLDEGIRFAKMADGLIDILQLRMWDGDQSHPTGYSEKINPTLEYAEAYKDAGLNMLVAPVGGFQDPAVIDEAISSGKTDLIAAARAFICDHGYAQKLKEGRREDVTPCVRCNRCHVISYHQPFLSMCTVNPKFGIEHVLDKAIKPPLKKKKVAIIGGGPAGMQAALVCHERGHDVTLFEQSSMLGGQLIPASKPEFKWPLKNYLEFMRRQVLKSGVEIRLNTMVEPAALEAGEFDTVISAVGGKPLIPRIPGVDNANVVSATEALTNPERVKGKVVIIGGGEIGTETGIHFSKLGHSVVVLEMQKMLAADAQVPHVGSFINAAVAQARNFTGITEAVVSRIAENTVFYSDGQGNESSVCADTVILATGTKACKEEAMAFYGTAEDYFMVGDCNKVGTVMTANRSAFATASTI